MFKTMRIRVIVGLFVSLVLQISVAPHCAINMIVPDLYAAFVMASVIQLPSMNVLVFLMGAGLLEELFTNQPVGVTTMALVVPVMGLWLITKKSNTDNPVINAVLLYITALAMGYVTVLGMCLTGAPWHNAGVLLGRCPASAFYTMLVAALIEPLAKKCMPRHNVQYELFQW